MKVLLSYCENIFNYNRRRTRVVNVGDVAVGGDNPIRVQSMTIADTMDTAATVAEVMQLVKVGCEIVRITAPSMKEAENLKNIKFELTKRGVRVPLVADIHYTPNAALIAADYVEKVRINPGNYADKKKFEQREYSDEEYEIELQRIEEKFKPLVLKCKTLGRAMRIGTNHGSLSDRIMNRYGDTAEGMVESALEFVRICQKYDYHDLILSMKSSNPQVAIQAYRLLAARMADLGMDYPFHLGVTEAGDGEEGRIKSAVGIGSLLEDGIGDTIRVSLTEDSVAEVPVAFKLVERFNRATKREETRLPKNAELKLPNPFEYERRPTLLCEQIFHRLGNNHVPRVELSLRSSLADISGARREIAAMLGKPVNPLNVIENTNGKQRFPCETIHVPIHSQRELDQFAKIRAAAHDDQLWVPFAVDFSEIPQMAFAVAACADRMVFSPTSDVDSDGLAQVTTAAKVFGKAIEWKIKSTTSAEIEATIAKILSACVERDYWNMLFSMSGANANGNCTMVRNYRYLAGRLDALGANFPLLLRYGSHGNFDSVVLDTSSQLGALICDGIGDALHIETDLPAADLLRLSYNILQATRLRISKTDYISCPSCGRTLFDLQTTTERIKSKTDHLTGVKIAIMGCIVNGPGEMADADFGYVGAGPKRVNLFVGRECVERNIPEDQADERLIELIKKRGMWVES
ncbi:MAG: (E)-4-hydroxy-3-methylbut-2-enyl-diphosphate synthase [bacterium]